MRIENSTALRSHYIKLILPYEIYLTKSQQIGAVHAAKTLAKNPPANNLRLGGHDSNLCGTMRELPNFPLDISDDNASCCSGVSNVRQ